MRSQRCPHCGRLFRPLAAPGRPAVLARHRVRRPAGDNYRGVPLCPGSGRVADQCRKALEKVNGVGGA